eukprot:15459501-Alexandrium_andersonii.AAC.1
MAQRQDQSTSTEHEGHGTQASPDANLAQPLLPADADAGVLAEWDRKGRQPDYVPLLPGHRLGQMQDVLLDSILQTMGEFNVPAVRLPQPD